MKGKDPTEFGNLKVVYVTPLKGSIKVKPSFSVTPKNNIHKEYISR